MQRAEVRMQRSKVAEKPHPHVPASRRFKLYSSPPFAPGHIVKDFLLDDVTPLQYNRRVVESGHEYNGFSLITATLRYKVNVTVE